MEIGEIVEFTMRLGGRFAIPPRKLKVGVIIPFGKFKVIEIDDKEEELTVSRLEDNSKIIKHVPFGCVRILKEASA